MFVVLIIHNITNTMKKIILSIAIAIFVTCLLAPLYVVANGTPQNAEFWVILYVLLTGFSGGYITIYDIKN
jgi:hypothetical protein